MAGQETKDTSQDKKEQQPQPQQPQQPPPSQQQPQQQQPQQQPPRSRRAIVLLAVFVALAAGAYIVWRAFFARPKLPDSIVALSGRIEGDDSTIAPKTAGRILEIRVRE